MTAVDADRLVAKVETQCGPHRVVSLMSSEAVNELGLAPGVLAVAVIKSTNVLGETPANPLRSAKSDLVEDFSQPVQRREPAASRGPVSR